MVNLGEDIAEALVELRAQAESMMQDSCKIESPDAGAGWDDASGAYLPQGWAVAYSGKCRVQTSNTEGSEPVVGGVEWQVGDVVVSIPVAFPLGNPDGYRVTITGIGPMSDPDLLETPFTVVAPVSVKSYATARRLHCQAVRA